MQPTLDTLQPSLEAMTPVLDELIEQLEASMKGSGKCSGLILQTQATAFHRDSQTPIGELKIQPAAEHF